MTSTSSLSEDDRLTSFRVLRRSERLGRQRLALRLARRLRHLRRLKALQRLLGRLASAPRRLPLASSLKSSKKGKPKKEKEKQRKIKEKSKEIKGNHFDFFSFEPRPPAFNLRPAVPARCRHWRHVLCLWRVRSFLAAIKDVEQEKEEERTSTDRNIT